MSKKLIEAVKGIKLNQSELEDQFGAIRMYITKEGFKEIQQALSSEDKPKEPNPTTQIVRDGIKQVLKDVRPPTASKPTNTQEGGSLLDNIIEMYPDENFLKIDGYDDAIIGVASDFSDPRLIYSVEKIIETLSKEMSYEDAIEYFEFNIAGAYMGKQTPIYCRHTTID